MTKQTATKDEVRRVMALLGSRTSRRKRASSRANFRRASQVRWANYRMAKAREAQKRLENAATT